MLLRGKALAWTTLRQRKQEQAETIAQETAELALEEEVIDFEAPETVAAIKAATRRIKGHVVLALPTDRVLLRVVDLPSVEREDLEGMVVLQVDKFSPFPIENMAVSFEVLDQGEDTSRVLVVAAPKRYIESIGGAFHRAGCTAHEMDVDVLGWWQLLRSHDAVAPEGQQVLVLADGEFVSMVVTRNGVPISFRSLGGNMDGTPVENAVEIAEEVNYTLTTLEATWGASATGTRLDVWHWADQPDEFVTQLEKACMVKCHVGNLETLPPLSEGIARRSMLGEGTHVDLAPGEWHDLERTRQLQKRLLRATAALVVIWLVGVVGFLVALQLQKSSVTSLVSRVDEVEGPADNVRQIMQKVREMEEYGARTHSALECLREISSFLPDRVDLTSFVYKKTREVSLRGQTDPNEVNQIYKFFEELEKSDLFEGASNQRVSTIGSGGNRKAQFTVLAQLPGGEEAQP